MRSAFFAGLTAVVLAVAAGVGLGSAPAKAQVAATNGPAPLSAYGALPAMELAQLSPSGKLLAFVTVSGEERMLVLLDLATKAQLGGVDVGRAKVRDLTWIGDKQVIIVTTKTETVPQLGLFRAELASGQIYDPAKNKIFPMLANTRGLFPALFGNVDVIQSPTDPQVFTRAYSFEFPERQDLYRINLETGRAQLAEVMGIAVTDYLVDAAGKSVARGEFEPVSQAWSLHVRVGDTFREVWRTTAPIEQPYLVGLGLNGDSVVVRAKRPDLHQDGREDPKYYDVNFATGAWRPVRFEFEPEALLFHPVSHRLIGATQITDEGRVYAFADPAARTLSDNVQRAFAGRGASLVNWSDDFRKGVVFVEQGQDSGTYYVVDLDAGKLTVAGKAYPEVTPDRVGPTRYVRYAAADGMEIHSFLTLPPGMQDAKNLPLIVLPHGGPATYDGSAFDWWSQALASRGYAVLRPNFRGSSGYGDAYMEAGYGEWGRKMQTDLSDGVRYLAKEGVIDPKRVCIVGASYGGYAALAGPTLDPGVYRCAVSVAGVSDLRLMVEDEASSGARRDNSTTRYWNRFMGASKIGDTSLDERSPARLVSKIDAPILLIHGRDDSIVPIEQSRMMADGLKKANKPYEFIELDGEDHWLSRSATRQRMLDETVRFLLANNPPK